MFCTLEDTFLALLIKEIFGEIYTEFTSKTQWLVKF